MRVPVLSGDGYIVEVESYKGKLFLHCSVTKNKPSVVKKLLTAWKGFRSTTNRDFYVFKSAKPSKHFLNMGGFDCLKAGIGSETNSIWVSRKER